jgi:hypothetical protein
MTNQLIQSLAGALLLLTVSNATHAEQINNMTVYKTPWCGCCEVWTKAMQDAGYVVEVKNIDNLLLTKRQSGVPAQLEACHTAVLGKYLIEGHLPLQAIDKLQSAKPNVRGIAVAGMPTGSLGMGYDPEARYDVVSFTHAKTERPEMFYEVGK